MRVELHQRRLEVVRPLDQPSASFVPKLEVVALLHVKVAGAELLVVAELECCVVPHLRVDKEERSLLLNATARQQMRSEILEDARRQRECGFHAPSFSRSVKL